VNYTDPKVAELAKQAAGDETDPRKLADKLSRFVSSHVLKKNLSVGFATASEVARSREGDCTEHGVLLAALGRANGIPSRIVTGLVYTDDFGGKSNVLVGHLWTQFWIAGRWLDVDAALGQHTDVDPTHIAMSVGSAGDDGFADLVASTWLSLGKLSITVEQTEFLPTSPKPATARP
jgi:transglutaminase-like putative cysteine protease